MCLEVQEFDDEDKVLVGGEGKLVEVVEVDDNLGAPASGEVEEVSTHPEQLTSVAPYLILISSLAWIT